MLTGNMCVHSMVVQHLLLVHVTVLLTVCNTFVCTISCTINLQHVQQTACGVWWRCFLRLVGRLPS
jgi:hypothetical protein